MTFFLLNWRRIKSMILTYSCLENFAHRKQYVRINGTNSTLVSVTPWVPQGSIVIPLLFLILINHLPFAILVIFADNNTFSSSANFSLGTLTPHSPLNRTVIVHTKSYWKLKSSWQFGSKIVNWSYHQPEKMARLGLKRINLQEKALNISVKGSFRTSIWALT